MSDLKIRVFHLIKGLGRGGAEVLLSAGLRYADRERFTYGYGYFLPHKDAVVPELEALGADVVNFNRPSRAGILLAVPQVVRHLKKWKADVIHCHLPLSGVTGRLAARYLGIPIVYTGHMEVEYNHPLTRAVNLATWRLQDRVIAVSEGSGASARRRAGEKVPITVVPNGVDTKAFQPDPELGVQIREKYSIAPNVPVIGTVAVFRRQKQLRHWVCVAGLVHKARPDVRFLIVGEGPTREAVEAEIREAGLEDVVKLAGFQDEVLPFLSAMDVYLMTSIIEGLPIALLEAMASGLPVVSTAVGGIPEVVEEDAGFLVPLDIGPEQIDAFMQGDETTTRGLGDADALASHIVTLCDDPDLRARMSAGSRAVIEARYSMGRMMRDLETIYTDVLGDRGTST